MPKQPPPRPKKLKAQFLFPIPDPTIKTPYLSSRLEPYPVGESTFEHLFKIYPVALSIFNFLSTIEHLTLRQVSITCRVYFDEHYSRQLSRLVLVRDAMWFTKFRKLRGVEEKLERDGFYRFKLEYYYKRKLEERAILKFKREEYRREVVRLLNLAGQFMPNVNGLPSIYSPHRIESEDWASEEEDNDELYAYPGLKDVDYDDYNDDSSSFVSKEEGEKFPDRREAFYYPDGTSRGPKRRKKLYTLPKPFALPPITYKSAVYQVEANHPWQYFYKEIDSNFLKHMLTSLMSEGRPLYEKITIMTLDGTNIDETGLRMCLDNCPQVRGISARGCPNINAEFWVVWLTDMITSKTKCGEYNGFMEDRKIQLRWLKVFPSGNFPTSCFDQVQVPVDARNEQEKHRFGMGMSFFEHLLITLPLVMSLNPIITRTQNPIITLFSRYRIFQQQLLESYTRWLNGGSQRGEPWLDCPLFRISGSIPKLLSLAMVGRVGVDFNYCASGDHCFSFVKESLSLNKTLPRFNGREVSHRLAGKYDRRARGGQKCAGCGVWEWEVESRPNTCIDPNYHQDRQKYKGKLCFGWKTPYASSPFAAMEGAFSYNAGVRWAKIIGTTEIYDPNNSESDKYLGLGLGAGSVCEECEQNMTCWSCGKFYCQICLFGPGPHITANKEPIWIPSEHPMPMPLNQFPLHGLSDWVENHTPRPPNASALNDRLIPAPLLLNTCKKGKHGPICWDCKTKWSDECDNCKSRFCKICNVGGIQLNRMSESDEQDLGPIEEDWEREDLPIEEGGFGGISDWGAYKNDYKLTENEDDSDNESLPSEAEIGGRTMEDVVEEAREDYRMISAGEMSAEYVEGRANLVGEDDSESESGTDDEDGQHNVPEPSCSGIPGEDNNFKHFEGTADVSQPTQAFNNPHEIYGHGFPQGSLSHNDSTLHAPTNFSNHPCCFGNDYPPQSYIAPIFTPSNTEFPPLPQLEEFFQAPKKHDIELKEALEEFGTLKSDLRTAGYREILIYSKCDICKVCICRVCSRGEDSWERCGGCGQKCCPRCVFQLCDACERALCENCFERETVSEMFMAMPRTPVPRFNPWAGQVGYYRDEIPQQGPPGPVKTSDPEVVYGKFKDGKFGEDETDDEDKDLEKRKGKGKEKQRMRDETYNPRSLKKKPGVKQAYVTSDAGSGTDSETSSDDGQPLIWGDGLSDEENDNEDDGRNSNKIDNSDNISGSTKHTSSWLRDIPKPPVVPANTPEPIDSDQDADDKREKPRKVKSKYEKNLEKFLKRMEEEPLPGNTLGTNEGVDEDFCPRCEMRRRIGFVKGEGYWEKMENQRQKELHELAKKGIHLGGGGVGVGVDGYGYFTEYNGINGQYWGVGEHQCQPPFIPYPGSTPMPDPNSQHLSYIPAYAPHAFESQISTNGGYPNPGTNTFFDTQSAMHGSLIQDPGMVYQAGGQPYPATGMPMQQSMTATAGWWPNLNPYGGYNDYGYTQAPPDTSSMPNGQVTQQYQETFGEGSNA